MKKVILPVLFALFTVLVGAGGLAAQTSTVAGDWDASMNTPGGPRPMKFTFKVDGEKLTGTAKRTNGDVTLAGTVKGTDITFSYTIEYGGNALTLVFTGKVKGDAMGGTVYFNETANDSWSATRTPPAKPKS